jgi:Fic family protein
MGGSTMQEEQYYTVAEAATILKVSKDTATRLFEDESGVLDLGSPEKAHKRRYRVLRIPQAVFNRVIHKLRLQ